MSASTPLHDVCIVGAGPAGATCAWYLAGQGRRVLLLDKARFPRDKLCGDAVCSRAQLHLERMGVLQEVLAAGEGKWAEVGGFVSPRGLSFIGNSTEHTGRPVVIAIKRIALDVRIARAAARAGAELVEGAAVTEVEPGPEGWTVRCKGEAGGTYRARVLILADGALSRIARALGIVGTPPDAVCSRAYVRAGTTDFDHDGVVFYPPALLPGYCALFREAGDELNFGFYVIPGGRARLTDLRPLYEAVLRDDPHVRAALGPRAVMDGMRAAPLRLGGIPRSYGDHLLVLGDAAGQIDPLTGEGIQYAMDAAEIAADTLAEAFATGDLSARALRRYHRGWMRAFGWDFAWSRRMAVAYTKFPVLLDAGAALARRRGTAFLAEWAEVMTGARPKRSFLRPGLLAGLTRELAGQCWSARVPTPAT